MRANSLSWSCVALRNAYKDFVENGLSAIRDRDEIFLRVRYTF